MADKILLNGEFWNPKEENLPCLITYAEKSGGSHFSIVMLADLFNNGSKILFFSAFPMARDNFLGHIKGGEDVSYVTKENDLKNDSKIIIIESGNQSLFLKALRGLEDVKKRVVLVKNIELFSSETIESCLKLDKVIVSGDVDLCSTNKKIMDKDFNTIVIFSNPKTTLPFAVPELEKYKGYIWSVNNKGIITVQREN